MGGVGGGGGGGGGGIGGGPLTGVARVTSLGGLGPKATGSAGPYDPSGDVLGQILNGLAGGFNTPGSPGSPGFMQSNAALRASIQAAGNQAQANRANVFSQIHDDVASRNPQIQQGYDAATAALQADARQRAIAAQGQQDTRNQQIQQGAAALGLSVVPDPSGSRAQQALNAQQADQQAHADAWAGFNGGAAQRAISRNNSVNDAFSWAGTQQQQQLANIILQQLAAAHDVYHAGSRGSAGKSLSPAQTLAGYNQVLSQLGNSKKIQISAQKLGARTTVKRVTPTGSTSTSYYGT